VAELANASLLHCRDPGSNLGADRKYFHILFVSNLNSNLEVVISRALFVKIFVY
jgi:predicted transcriptional regulator